MAFFDVSENLFLLQESGKFRSFLVSLLYQVIYLLSAKSQ